METHIRRIEAVNGRLNAVVATRFEQAVDEARAVDATRDARPLAGVPFTVKEFVAVEGQPHTGGVVARRHQRAAADASVVARLRAAGAIVVGMTNAPEGGLWHETNNPVYGRTSNPWDTLRTPGGSSGGEGAILAAGGAPFGVGSDTGGSIRMPAAFCGICGHKPTGGLVPTTGHFPDVPVADVAALVVGPMARRTEDLPLLLSTMAGPDGIDTRCRPATLGDPEQVDWGRVRVVALPDNGRSPVRPEVAVGVHKAAAALVARGARLETLAIEDLDRGFDLWAAMMSDAPVALSEVVSAEPGLRKLQQILRFPLGRAHHSGGVLLMLALERLMSALPYDGVALAARGRALRERMDHLLGDHTVLVHPTFPRTAPRHRGMVIGRPWDIGYTATFNLTEQPVTVVPVDVDPKGLPVGVQLIAARGRDHLTLAAAAVVEDAFGGWRGPVEPMVGRRWPWSTR